MNADNELNLQNISKMDKTLLIDDHGKNEKVFLYHHKENGSCEFKIEVHQRHESGGGYFHERNLLSTLNTDLKIA
mgnify:CR=1 FL=1